MTGVNGDNKFRKCRHNDRLRGILNMSFEDYHVHCEFSDDSDYPMEQVVLDAVDMGMNEICFTDHVDYGVKDDWDTREIHCNKRTGKPVEKNVNYPLYFEKLNEMQEKYRDQIIIRKGLEMGMQVHTVPDFMKLYQSYKDQLDFVILSCHQVDDMEFWTGEYQEGKTAIECTRRYYEEILRVISLYKNYSVLGHLDMIIRYDQGEHVPFDEVKDLIAAILRRVITDGKGIELNTSNVRYQIGDLTPSRDILRLYYDLGGRIITIGSDSHKPDHLGFGIEEQKEELRKIGFKHYHTFENMKPIEHEL